jgi:hypothetical protein
METSEKPEPSIDYYTCADPDELTHDDPDEAVEEYLDGFYGMELPETVEVKRYCRRVIGERQVRAEAEYALGGLMERLDEEYGSPDNATDITAEMRTVMLEAVQKVVGMYSVWTCEEVKPPLEVSTAEWIRKNAPEWLENPKLRAEVEQLEKDDEEPGH